MERGREDRHQFRFIVAPEDGDRLTDLRGFTRDVMGQMEQDLGTELEWVAVDHFNTGHPHSHVVIRGKDETGKDLIIAQDYITDGVRLRAQDRATLELGPETDLELRQKLTAEITAERFTRIDRAMIAEAQESGLICGPKLVSFAPILIARSASAACRLCERYGLATEIEPGVWALSEKLEPIPARLGRARRHRQGDQSRALRSRRRAGARQLCSAWRAGLVADRRPGDRQGADRRTRRAPRPHCRRRRWPRPPCRGGRGGGSRRGEDWHYRRDCSLGWRIRVRRTAISLHSHATRRLSSERASRHGRSRQAFACPAADYESYIQSHVRRLEALRRAGIVERIDADHWHIPKDFEKRAADYDAQRRGRMAIRLLSAIDLEAQISADGATWLDRELVSPNRTPLTQGGFRRRCEPGAGAAKG